MGIIRSTNLEKFIDENGLTSLIEIWDVSYQAIDKARKANRDIQIVELDDYIEIRESKVLKRVRVNA